MEGQTREEVAVTPTTLLMGQILVVFGIVISGTWIATQWTAAALGYQLRLGTPWFQFGALPVYYPWRLLEWWYAYEAYAPAVFNRGGLIADCPGCLPVYGGR